MTLLIINVKSAQLAVVKVTFLLELYLYTFSNTTTCCFAGLWNLCGAVSYESQSQLCARAPIPTTVLYMKVNKLYLKEVSLWFVH